MRENSVPMDSNSPPHRRKARSDLVHLRSLLPISPSTATGQVTAGLERNRGGARERQEAQRGLGGRKLDALEIPYPRFRVYVSRLRRRQRRSSAPQLPPVPTNVDHGPPDPPLDPFRNRREQREKK